MVDATSQGPNQILKPNEVYTFRQYCELRYPVSDILIELGVAFSRSHLTYPSAEALDADRLEGLRQRLEEAVLRISLTSEAARQQALIAPYC